VWGIDSILLDVPNTLRDLALSGLLDLGGVGSDNQQRPIDLIDSKILPPIVDNPDQQPDRLILGDLQLKPRTVM